MRLCKHRDKEDGSLSGGGSVPLGNQGTSVIVLHFLIVLDKLLNVRC